MNAKYPHQNIQVFTDKRGVYMCGQFEDAPVCILEGEVPQFDAVLKDFLRTGDSHGVTINIIQVDIDAGRLYQAVGGTRDGKLPPSFSARNLLRKLFNEVITHKSN